MKSVEEWEKSFNKRLDGTPYYLSTASNDKWYMRKLKEHILEAIRDEQREACADAYCKEARQWNVFNAHCHTAILNAGKAD